MTRLIAITPRASFDLDQQVAYIAKDNLDVALRFFDSARQTFSQIAQTPDIGRLYKISKPRLSGLQKWSVKGFEKYLIFYRLQDDRIEVVRILHAARDIPTILEQEG